MPEVSGAFHLPFDYQIAALRLRLGNLVPTSRYYDLRREQHDRGFMIAGATKADLLADLAKAVDKAVAAGTSLEEFRRDFRRIVAERGWHGWTGEVTKAGEAWRTRVIYRTNISTSYAAGRWAQLKEAGFDYWVYRHSGAEHPRLDHLSWDRVVLPADHPFWAQHYPPNGWGCGCRVAGARTRDGARRVGGDPDKDLPENWQDIDPRTGAPVGIGKGWDYAPGQSVENDILTMVRKAEAAPDGIGSDLLAALVPDPPHGPASPAFALRRKDARRESLDRQWRAWHTAVVEDRVHRPGFVGWIGDRELDALGRHGITCSARYAHVRPGLIVGPKARRHDQAGDALSFEDWQHMAQSFAAPSMTLFDVKSKRLLYILGGDDERVMMLAVNPSVRHVLRLRPGRMGFTTNMVTSAHRPRFLDLEGRIRSGLLKIIRGKM